MGWFQLDPRSIANRARNRRVPSLAESIWRGILGFTLVSVAGFAPWAVGGRWFYRNTGETGLYIVCAVVFMGLSGLLLHKLILGAGSLLRFYAVFSVAFVVYAAAWIIAWMRLKGHPGSIVGLLAGTVLMGLVLAEAFESRDRLPWIIPALFVLNTAGYFIGGWIEAWVASNDGLFGMPRAARVMLAKSLWGVFYGIGFGAGLGIAFYLCQSKARTLLVRSNGPLR